MMVGKHSKQTDSPSTPTATDTQANAAPATDAENDTTNTAAAPEVTSSTPDTPLREHLGRGSLFGQENLLGEIEGFASGLDACNKDTATSARMIGTRNKTITMRLLQAVAYGMESEEANVPVKASDAGHLFKSHLYAKPLLQKSPEFLLARGELTDWAGREFKNITAFEYALWAKDFKMLEMMLDCIPNTPEGDVIREALWEQAKQVQAPIEAGGGLTYTHTYDRPNVDASGIPDGTTTSVTEVHTENHFNIAPLCDAYQDYETHFDTNVDGSARTWPQRDAYWVTLIGKLQRLLPVHILQRYCDPQTPFYPFIESHFKEAFKRSTSFYNFLTDTDSSLIVSSLSTDFALIRGRHAYGGAGVAGRYGEATWRAPRIFDLAAVRQLDKVSTNEIEKITRQLSQPRHAAGPRL